MDRYSSLEARYIEDSKNILKEIAELEKRIIDLRKKNEYVVEELIPYAAKLDDKFKKEKDESSRYFR